MMMMLLFHGDNSIQELNNAISIRCTVLSKYRGKETRKECPSHEYVCVIRTDSCNRKAWVVSDIGDGCLDTE